MKHELTTFVIIAITAVILVLLREHGTLAAAIMAVGLVFCLYEVLERKNLESAIQWHWLLVAIAAGVAWYKFRLLALTFLAATFAIRFAASLIRFGETKEILAIVEKAKREHENEIDRIKSDMAAQTAQFQQKLFLLNADKICTVREYEQQQEKLRADLEEDYRKKFSELEIAHKSKCRELENTLAKNQQIAVKERDELERKKIRVEQDLAVLKNKTLTTLAKLQDRLDDQDDYIKNLETEAKRAQNEIYSGNELHKLLRKTLDNAKIEVDIMSPWVTNRIVNGDIQAKIERLLKRNVTIKIAYGTTDTDKRAKDTEEFVEELQRRFRDYKNFRVKKIITHGKIFICDDEYYVLTSMNPLSNDGKFWLEIGEMSHNRETLFKYRKWYFNF